MPIQKFKNPVSEEYVKTRELFAEAEYTDANLMIATVFLSQYNAALTVDRIEKIIFAMYDRKIETEKELGKLVKAGILRKRKSVSNTTLYEVNY